MAAVAESSQQFDQTLPDFQVGDTLPDFQVVKCVVVGDTGVGKTRLICGKACGTKYTLRQLKQIHGSTVWAIDHYRQNKEVMDRSWCLVDGCQVSLQLWDTFGYHDKDRRFAYGRADVVLLCFSVVRPRSLHNIRNHWFPEIQRLLPRVPIILCGNQIDLRYLYMDKEFLDLDKGPFFREITADDIIPPCQGRAMAKEIGAHYYETSALNHFGVDDVFPNVVRAALQYKREKHIWNVLSNSLKRVQRPQCQAPFQPPKPAQPSISIHPSTWERDLAKLQDDHQYSDLVIVVQGVRFHVHKVIFIAASRVFEQLLAIDLNVSQEELDPDFLEVTCTPFTTSGKIVSTHIDPDNLTMHFTPTRIHPDTAPLLDYEEIELSTLDLSATCILPSPLINTNSLNHLPKCVLNTPAFYSIELQESDPTNVFSNDDAGQDYKTVVTLDDKVTPAAFQAVQDFIYTGQCRPLVNEVLDDVRWLAKAMGLPFLATITQCLMNKEEYLVADLTEKFHLLRKERLRNCVLQKTASSDVVFDVDDEKVVAHKSILTCRCDVMAGMFNYNFMESSAKTVSFPGVTMETFSILLEFLYTGEVVGGVDVDTLEGVELANRMCLPELRALLEHQCVEDLQSNILCAGVEVGVECLDLLEPAQLHNSNQLAEWCLWYLACHYQIVYRHYSKVIHHLQPENQIILSQRRWPPVWYLKEQDYYERCMLDLEREKKYLKPSLFRRNSDDFSSGCLGFCSRRNRKMKCEPHSSTDAA